MLYGRRIKFAMDPTVPLDQLIPPPTERDDTHKVYSIAIACIILGVLGSAFVCARLWYRLRTKTFGIDDYAIVPSFVSASPTRRSELRVLIYALLGTLSRLDRPDGICRPRCRS